MRGKREARRRLETLGGDHLLALLDGGDVQAVLTHSAGHTSGRLCRDLAALLGDSYRHQLFLFMFYIELFLQLKSFKLRKKIENSKQWFSHTFEINL